MAFKIIGIMFVIMTTTLIGIGMARSLSERENRLRLIVLMLDRFSTLIDFQGVHTGQLLIQTAQDSQFKELCFLKKAVVLYNSGEKFANAWEIAIKNDTVLGEEEKSILICVGNSIGRSNTDGQLSMLSVHRQSIEKLYENISHENLGKGKLYRSLGVLAGVFISVMIV